MKQLSCFKCVLFECKVIGHELMEDNDWLSLASRDFDDFPLDQDFEEDLVDPPDIMDRFVEVRQMPIYNTVKQACDPTSVSDLSGEKTGTKIIPPPPFGWPDPDGLINFNSTRNKGKGNKKNKREEPIIGKVERPEDSIPMEKPVMNREDKFDQAELSGIKTIDLIEFNRKAEDRFIELATRMIKEKGTVPLDKLYAEIAYELDISIVTVKRYVQKHTASRAEFRFIQKQGLAMNPNFTAR
jgi:hypothetical protein